MNIPSSSLVQTIRSESLTANETISKKTLMKTLRVYTDRTKNICLLLSIVNWSDKLFCDYKSAESIVQVKVDCFCYFNSLIIFFPLSRAGTYVNTSKIRVINETTTIFPSQFLSMTLIETIKINATKITTAITKDSM